MLDVRGIDVFYGSLQILWNVSLKVEHAESVALIGPNGHGKTTILKTISGLLHPINGYIKFYDKDISTLPSHKIVEMGIIHIPQDVYLFPDMAVMENLMLGAYTKDAWKRRHERLKLIFELFPSLSERKNLLARSLSGGERRMLVIGRGLMSNVKLLLIDEPSCGLAPKLVKQVFQKIKEFKEEMKLTMLLAEQNIRYLPEIADRVYLIENGRVMLGGQTDEVLSTRHIKETYLGK